MNERQTACAILFADIAGSTRLYERLGDEQAQKCVSKCLTRLSGIATEHGGVVIKFIGDEIMCRFDTSDAAINAACEMHESLANGLVEGPPLAIRVGIHYGPAILQSGDVFGDAVNICARMTAIAKAGQIITTEDTITLASPDTQTRARPFDRSTVRGRDEAIDIYQVLWEPDSDVTLLASLSQLTAKPQARSIKLRYRGGELDMDLGSGSRLLGRDPSCDLVVAAELASRHHARIDHSRGKFVLVDQSTNGTYVKIRDGKEVYLRREALPLHAHGVISLGRSCGEEREHLIQFECE